MAKFSGRQTDLGVAVESTRGTPVSPTFWIPRVDMSFDDKTEVVPVQSGVGTLEDTEQAHVIKKWAEGDVGAEIRDRAIGVFLKAMFGTVTTTGPASGAYTHTFALEDTAQHDSLTFTVVDPNNTDQYTNVMLTTLEFKQELGDIARFTATFMGKTSKGSSASTDYTAENKFSKIHFAFKVATALSGLTVASPSSIKSITLTLNSNVVEDDALGTAVPEDFLNRQFACEGQVSLNYENSTWKEYAREGTYRAMEIKWENSDVNIPGGTTHPSLTFQMPKVYFYEWEPNMALDEIVSQTISFKACRDLENAQAAVSAVLINEYAGTNY